MKQLLFIIVALLFLAGISSLPAAEDTVRNLSSFSSQAQLLDADAGGQTADPDKSELDDIDDTHLTNKCNKGRLNLDVRVAVHGSGVDGFGCPLIRLSPKNGVCVGARQFPLTLLAAERPAVSIKDSNAQTSEKIAYLSDFTPYASLEQLAGSLAAKADLVDGTVPLLQLPP